MNINELVDKYIALRDKKSQLKKEYDGKVAAIDEALDKAEKIILQQMNAQGVEAFKTSAGTTYRSIRSSASVADRDAYLSFCQETGDWSMLDVRANKTAVQAYRDTHQDLPPGVNWSEQVVVNVRRN